MTLQNSWLPERRLLVAHFQLSQMNHSACLRCSGTGALDLYLYSVAMELACPGVRPTVLRRLG